MAGSGWCSSHAISSSMHGRVKLLKPEHTANPLVLQRFLQEARSAAKVAHPGIVTVFECGQTPEGAYIVMELLHGETVARRMRTRLPESKVIEIGRQVASALQAAHVSRIVHRDLKPSNVPRRIRPRSAVSGSSLDFGSRSVRGHQVRPGDGR